MVKAAGLVAMAAAVLAAVLPVTAEPEQPTVKMSFEKRKLHNDDPQAMPRNFKRANPLNVVIDNEQLIYLINITVGTPGQPISLVLDTGSSDIWFPSASATICQREGGYYCQLGSYAAANSSTFGQLQLPSFQIQYGDGSEVLGTYFTDVVKVGSASVTNVTMAAARQVTRPLGVMGIGFQNGESSTALDQPFTYPNIVNQLQSQGIINTLSYSLWLDDFEANTGSVLFGGVDTSKYTGSLIALPVQKNARTNQVDALYVAWTGLTITGGGNNANLSPSSPQAALLDSGTTISYLPDDVANNIFQGVGVTQDDNYGSIVPCSIQNDNLTFAFQFGGSDGPTIRVPLSEFVNPILTADDSVPKFPSGQSACQFGIFAAGNDPVILGDTFLRSAYVVYDLSEQQIALAQLNTNANDGTGNVAAFSSGAGIPDATRTVSGVTVAQTFSSNFVGTGEATATGTGTAVSGTRSATFRLVSGSATASGSGSGSGSGGGKNSAGRAVTTDRSLVAILAVTGAAFLFGALLL